MEGSQLRTFAPGWTTATMFLPVFQRQHWYHCGRRTTSPFCPHRSPTSHTLVTARLYRNENLILPRPCILFSVADSQHLVHGIAAIGLAYFTDSVLNSRDRPQQLLIHRPFCWAPRTNQATVMYLRADSRRRNTNKCMLLPFSLLCSSIPHKTRN